MNGLLSIIIPTLNEQNVITETLRPLQALRKAGHQVIVVDGNSTDDTRNLAAPLADSVLLEGKGRARQMRIGARFAHHDILVFLRTNTHLPARADMLIINGLAKTGLKWGRFDVHLVGQAFLLRVVERHINWRSYLTSIATGDQAIFIQRDLYTQIQGIPDIPLMEDIALSRRLRHFGRPLCIKTPVVISNHRWKQHGIARTILLKSVLRLAYGLGINPQILKRYYHH